MVFWAKIRSYEIICVIGKFLDNFMNYNNLKYMIFDKISIAPTRLRQAWPMPRARGKLEAFQT